MPCRALDSTRRRRCSCPTSAVWSGSSNTRRSAPAASLRSTCRSRQRSGQPSAARTPRVSSGPDGKSEVRSLKSEVKNVTLTRSGSVDVCGADVVHAVGGAQCDAARTELPINGQLVMLFARVGDAVHREHAAPPLAVMRELDALDG